MDLVQYKTIVSALKNPLKRAELDFVVESAEVFERYSKVLQKSVPLIHVLYESLEDLTGLLMRRAFKPETILRISSIEDVSNLLPIDKVTAEQLQKRSGNSLI